MIRQVPLLCLVISTSFACSGDGPAAPQTASRWTYLGLGGETVYVVEHHEGSLYAGTGNGIYRRALDAADSGWSALGLQGRRIDAVLPLDAATLLAAVRITGMGSDTTSLYRSTDGGASWDPYRNGFGEGEGSNYVRDLALLDDGALLASGGSAVIAKSPDTGASWRTVWGGWWWGAVHTFVHTDASWPGLVWAGGEGAYFQPFLLYSTDRGESWREIAINVGGDNAHYSVAIDPRNSMRVYTGMEGRILRSTDGGERWDIVFAPSSYPYFFGLAVSLSKPERIFAAGSINTLDPQQLVIYVSENGGDSWAARRPADGRNAGVRDLLLLVTPAGETVILATDRGVHSYEHEGGQVERS